jgi:ribonuclease HI
MKKIAIYADGACSGNPGPGGYGAILQYGESAKQLSQGFIRTTNNRMELRAVIAGLQALKEPCEVTVVTDSQYVVNGITQGWAKSWRANGWRKKDKKPALNPDLWQELLDSCEKHTVRFEWIRGHNGHPQNEMCDEMAVSAYHREGKIADQGFAG